MSYHFTDKERKGGGGGGAGGGAVEDDLAVDFIELVDVKKYK